MAKRYTRRDADGTIRQWHGSRATARQIAERGGPSFRERQARTSASKRFERYLTIGARLEEHDEARRGQYRPVVGRPGLRARIRWTWASRRCNYCHEQRWFWPKRVLEATWKVGSRWLVRSRYLGPDGNSPYGLPEKPTSQCHCPPKQSWRLT